jgi:hypothetical protein
MEERRHHDVEIISEIAVLGATLKSVQEDIAEIKKKLDSQYVSRMEFELRVKRLESIIYGILAIVGTAVLGAILSLVIK